MDPTLSQRSCVPCRGDVPPMAREDAEGLLAQIPGWRLDADATRLERTYAFRNFLEAQMFAVRVGDLAESEGHHPEITYGWGRCTVRWRTGKIGGLHENDFIMAAKTDDLAAATDPAAARAGGVEESGPA